MIEVPTVAALYVERGGVYYGLPGVEPWDAERDARLYAGPWPVVCHPPCQRWGRYWSGGPSHHGKFKLGDDHGCFAAALAAVRRWGGVLEHPCDSHAWRAHELRRPPKSGGWFAADFQGGWSCCVEQGHYGHVARKATWLYAVGCELPSLTWGKAEGKCRLDDGFHTTEERRRLIQRSRPKLCSHKQRAASSEPFRDLLLSIARSARRREEVA